MAIKKVMVLGTGQMGSGIAQVFASHGIDAYLRSRKEASVEKALARIEKGLNRNVEKGRITEEQKADTLAHLHGVVELTEETCKVDLIVESVAVGIVVALVIPIAKLGRKLAEACKARPGTIKFNLINGFPFTVINSCLLGTIMSGLGIFQARRQMPMEVLIKQPPFVKVWLGSCLENLPIAIIVSYILAIIISPIVVKMVGPGGPPPENRKPEN